MPMTPVAGSLEVDLGKAAPAQRWANFRGAAGPQFDALCGELRNLFFRRDTLSGRAASAFARAMYAAVYRRYGRFIEESDYLTTLQSTRVLSESEVALMQRQYSWAIVYYSTLGCTTACVETADGWRMMRSLDWANRDIMSPAVIRIVYKGAGADVQTAAIAGMIGVLTFSRPGLCGAINFAPTRRFADARAQSDPLFCMRDLVEDSKAVDLRYAVDKVLQWRTSAPVFVTLCSPAGAAAVEIAGGRARVREATGGLLVQGNHYQCAEFARFNRPQVKDSEELLETSDARVRDCSSAFAAAIGKDAESVRGHALDAYDRDPVFNHETMYWTWNDPAAGSMEIWRYAG